MAELYDHQVAGVKFLVASKSALLADEMGLGKSRQALIAARELFAAHKIDRVLVLAPAAVRSAWREEMNKLDAQGDAFTPCVYEPKSRRIYGTDAPKIGALPVLVLSYSLLPQKRHVEALAKWCAAGRTLLVCDESSFLKNRTAKQTKGAAAIGKWCAYRWLLTGTPIANSPLDLYGQALVMSNGAGPLKTFKNFYQFQARYALTEPRRFGLKTFKQVVGYQNIDELTRRFAPYVLRRTKEECLDLPAKTFTVREVPLSAATWSIYQELKRDALLALPNEDMRPEPNAAVRILRLCQLTSGHIGVIKATRIFGDEVPEDCFGALENAINSQDISSEKIEWLSEQILTGELSGEQAIVIWCRWRRERERLKQLLATKIEIYGIFGGQQEKNRSADVQAFQSSTKRRVMIAQQHAGSYGLTLHAASTAVYLSNSFSYTDRIQSGDRIHRIGQTKPCLYVDVLAVSPKGSKTIDHHVLECLQAKRDLAALTCSAWRRVLEEF